MNTSRALRPLASLAIVFILAAGLILVPSLQADQHKNSPPATPAKAEKAQPAGPMDTPAKPPVSVMEITSQLWFEGTSTVRDWACKKAPVNGEITVPAPIQEAESSEELRSVLKALPDTAVQARMEFPVQQIRCEQGERMNNHLRHALKAKKYPNITFELRSIRIEDRSDTGDGFPARVRGELTIKGTTKTVSIPVRVENKGKGTLHVSGTKKLDMTQYGVEPPTIMWTITVYDNITIHTDFVLRPSRQSS